MSAFEEAAVSTTPIPSITKILTDDLGVDPKHITASDCITIARISEIVGTRGARLSATALVSVLRQTGNDKEGGEKVDFGLDGSLIELYVPLELVPTHSTIR